MDTENIHNAGCRTVRRMNPGLRDSTSSTEEENAALEAKCPAHEFCLDSDDAIRRRGAIAAEVSALKKENARLKAPVSDAEMEEQAWMADDEGFKDAFDNIIEARSKAPDGAQEAEG